jgi:transposase
MVLGASSYTYAEATLDQQMAAWLGCHIHAFEYFQAVPKLLVPDNTRTGVSRACRYDPDLNPTYQEMAMHYGIGVVPARPYRPRDKAKVESGVLVAERWIMSQWSHARVNIDYHIAFDATQLPSLPPPLPHDNIRGGEYFD